MRSVLAGTEVPTYLSPTAVDLLAEARAKSARFGLARYGMVDSGSQTELLPWVGSRAMAALAAQLTHAGLETGLQGCSLHVSERAERVLEVVREFADGEPADPVALAESVANKATEKYDRWLDDELLSADHAARALDCVGAWRSARALAASGYD